MTAVLIRACHLDTPMPVPPLSNEDTQRLAALVNPRRRDPFVAGRALLATGGIDNLAVGSAGKPHASQAQFSIAHSGDWVAVVVGDAHPVGIDLEQIKPRRNLDSLRQRTLCVPDAVWRSLPEPAQLELFFSAWTLREALAKADGRGLAWALEAVQLHGHRPGGAVALDVQCAVAGYGWIWQLSAQLMAAIVTLAPGALSAPPNWPDVAGWQPRLVWQGGWSAA